MKKIQKQEKIKSANNSPPMIMKLNTADYDNHFAENIINTVREPLIVLDRYLKVVTASRSFYDFFKVKSDETIGRLIYDLGNLQWNIPKLKELLETILPEKTTFDNYEVEHDFPAIGKRIMLLNARQIERAFGKEKIILLAIEDITERRHKEKTLSEKNRMTSEYLDILLDHAHAPIIIWDSSFVIKRFNHEFEKLSGYSSAEVIDKKIDIVFPEDKIDLTLELIKNNISDDKSEILDIDILTKDKDVKTVLWNSSNIFDKEGNKIVATIAQDITGRKLTEEALRESEAKFKTMVTQSPDGILIMDLSGTFLSVNKAMCDLLNYSEEELLLMNVRDILPEHYITLFRNRLATLIKGESNKDPAEYEVIGKDGSTYSIEIVAAPFYKRGKIIGFQATARDVTERKNTLEALKRNEQKFMALAEQSPNLIFINYQGRVVYVNQKCVDLMGYSKEEYYAKDFDFMVLIEQSYKDIIKQNFYKSMNGHTVEPLDYQIITKNGIKLDAIITTELIDYFGAKAIMGTITDITERKHAEEVLKRSEAQLKEAQKIAKVGHGDWEIESDTVLWSDELFQIAGLDPDMSPPSVAGHQALYTGESWKKLERAVQRAVEDGIDYDLELEMVRPDGKVRSTHTQGHVIRNQNGKVVRLLGTVQDITERKQAEESLNLFRMLLDKTNDAIELIDMATGKYIDVNEIACTDLGYSRSELLSMTVFDIDPNQTLYNFQTMLKEFDQSKSTIIESVHRRKDGSTFPVEMNITLVRLEKMYTIIIVRDITERKIAEKELATSEERYRLLFQSAAEGILVADVETKKHKLVNKAVCRMFGYTEQEMIGLTIKDMHPPESLAYVISEFESQAQGERPFSTDIPCLRKDGTIFFANIYNAIIYIDNRKHNIGFFTDITAQKEASDKIKLFRTLIDQSNDAVELIDMETGSFLDCNEKAYRELGYTREEFLSLKIFNIDPNLTEDSFPERIKLIRDSGSLLIDGMHIRKDGSEIPVEINIKYVKLEREYIVAVVRNITERKLVEERLRSSEEMFKIIFDYAPEAYYINDLKGNFINGNIAAEKLLGYKSDELIGKSFFKLNLLSPIQILKAAKLLAKNLVGKATGPDEFMLDRKDGSKITVEISTYPVKIKENTLVLGIARDITESKQLEQEKEILTYHLNERVKELTCLYTIASIFETTDISLDKMFNQVVKSIPPGWQYSDICCARIVLDKNEYQTTNYKGTAWKMSADIKIDEKIRGIVEVFYLEEKEEIDEGPFLKEERELLNQIAERMGQILERKKLESDLYTAAEIAKLGYWEYDVDSGDVIFNDQYFSLVHGSSTEKQDGNIMSMEEFALKLVHPDDLGLITNALQEAKESMEINYLGKSEVRVFRENGDIAYVSVLFKVLKDQLGRTYKIYGVSQDITERKMAEQELIEAKEKAEEMNKLKSSFLANMSHELRTPLIGILGYAEFLISDLQDPDLIEMASTIKTSGQRLNHTLNNILNISKIESERQQNNFKIYDLIKIVKEQMNLFKAAAEGKNLLLTLETEEEKLDAYVDENMFISIINNLLNNAIKYTEIGAVILSAKREKEYAIIKVTDTGIGIAEDSHEIIFAPFRQASEGYGRSFEGSGLGLTLVKKYMDFMNGTIILKSKPGSGSTFILKLPIRENIPEILIKTNWS